MVIPLAVKASKARHFAFRLYPDCPNHIEFVDSLDERGWKYAKILHDRDIWEIDDPKLGDHTPGEIKKPHWHIVVSFANPRYLNSVFDESGLDEMRHLQVGRNKDALLRYLVHDGTPDKAQYQLSEVSGPMASDLAKLLADDECDRVRAIVHIIDEHPGKARYREILLKVCEAGLYGDFRRMGSGVRWLLDEHNEEIISEETARVGLQFSKSEFDEFIKWAEVFRKAEKSF